MARRLFRSCALVALPCAVSGQWSPPDGCDKGWAADECCCMTCADEGKGHAVFGPQKRDVCVSAGGQCKTPSLSSYSRGPPSAPAHPSNYAKPMNGEPEQVHLIGGYSDEITVRFVTDVPAASKVEIREAIHLDMIKVHEGSSEAYSFQIKPTGWNGYDDPTGPHPGPAYKECDGGYTSYMNTTCMSTSGLVHTVRISNLKPGSRYEYRPIGSERWRPFLMPPAIGEPIKFGIVADLGQTMDSLTTMRHMKDALNEQRMHAALFPGDLSYADGVPMAWDSYGRLGEFLWETLPTAYGAGNHEYGSGAENFVNFLPRYGWTSRDRSGSASPLWFSFEAGLAHVVMLCSYCDTRENGLQHTWLSEDLRQVDRERTPWVIALWHTPWYTSNAVHSMAEGLNMRQSLESILHAHAVDFVFVGHVHAYERTRPIYKNETKCDGPVYITIGDGGNHEGPACPWAPVDYEWSVLKEFSFGYGLLDLVNGTHARWEWHRNQDGSDVHGDLAWIRPASQRCGDEELVV